MSTEVKIKTALISVYSKDRIEEIIRLCKTFDIRIYSTGGTYEFIKKLGYDVTPVEDVTSYPSILGGRVKTLHPKIFGGILYRRNDENDLKEIAQYEIPPIDLVLVDLYPFEQTVASTTDEQEIIEKIDIGGISLIRAAAKNYQDVVIVPSVAQYDMLIDILQAGKGATTLEQRKYFAAQAFNVSSDYDTKIFEYFNKSQNIPAFKKSILTSNSLRYGENPHQQASFYGNLNKVFEQLHGKEISYNNLVDIDAAISLIGEFSEPTAVIIKHTNACGIASRTNLKDAWKDALACDPVSAYGGVFIVNRPLDLDTANEINKMFFEVLIAEEYEDQVLDILKSKKNRIILKKKPFSFPGVLFKSLLNGAIEQERDLKSETETDFHKVTTREPSPSEVSDMIFANKIVKHLKSNSIVLVKNKQLTGSGVGQTSRVDALKQAIVKAHDFNLDLKGAVMASDAYFPFADSVEIAFQEGITAVIQPGGSIRDADSIHFCENNNMSMVFTGIRHFKH
ncbi:MAG: bifunctional phosphoribosylaminoimidazolecarboxamide formyltransferase/IMP cyclohydrolase [Bacteroidota bacterium]|nr:bifunctional phosphoribosylaminoimidazolecarboxamide formyltransferase/IMP cyclohydrolase [Bacteroidota bacterium]